MPSDPALEIRPAQERDLTDASAILVEAAEWLIALGKPLWRPEDLAPERIRSGVDDGSLHLGWHGDVAVGTIAFSFEDPVFWPEAVRGESAFVHRLAVRRQVAGGIVAPALLDWACAKAHLAGRQWLRLDCSSAHEGLVRYYERAGFERCGEQELGGYRVVLFQRPLEVAAGREGVDSHGTPG